MGICIYGWKLFIQTNAAGISANSNLKTSSIKVVNPWIQKTGALLLLNKLSSICSVKHTDSHTRVCWFSVPRLCSVLRSRDLVGVCWCASHPCWPASVWGTTPRPSDRASESPERSCSSAPGEDTHRRCKLDARKTTLDQLLQTTPVENVKHTHTSIGDQRGER